MSPIVIIGGFLSYSWFYREMQQELISVTGCPVYIAHISGHEWLLAGRIWGWARLLEKLDQAIRAAEREDPGNKITLIGHSAGGVLARLYLSPDSFQGRIYQGLERIEHLITLGSPHYNQRNLRRGGRLSTYVEERYPGAYFQPDVHYTSFAGKFIRGDHSSRGFPRWAYAQYKDICGQGDIWGDGLIPVQSALLSGSNQVILEGVSHHSVFGNPWYGSKSVINKWWEFASGKRIN